MNTEDFIYHLQGATEHIEWLNKYCDDSIVPQLRKDINKVKSSSSKDTTIPYVDFKIDEKPIFKNEPPPQLSFEDLNKDKYIAPIRRRKNGDLSYKGVCPYCGAPNEYIYDNSKGRGQ